ncbi:MAG: hypothetical protein ACI8UO_001902 [Verrucomicrobiales bacterium]|jgi:hypothetical protein
MKTNLNPNDPRLTAWTLDEMSDPERKTFETDLEQTPNSEQLLDEVADTAAEVREMFRMEEIRTGEIEIPALSATPKNIIRAEFWTTRAAAITAAAAGLVAAIGVFVLINSLDLGSGNERLQAKLAEYEATEGDENVKPEFRITILHEHAPQTIMAQQLPELPQIEPLQPAPFQLTAPDHEHSDPQPVVVPTAEVAGFAEVKSRPESKFSLAIGDSSYSQIEQALTAGRFPDQAAVRVEELVNHFAYDYTEPENSDNGVSVDMEVAECPWNPLNRLVRIGMHGAVLARAPSDAPVQVNFNPFKVRYYRLIGYTGGNPESGSTDDVNRPTGRQTITALYEIEPIISKPATNVAKPNPEPGNGLLAGSQKGEAFPFPQQLLTLELGSERAQIKLIDEGKSWLETSDDFRFAASVAAFGMWLSGEESQARLNPSKIAKIAEQSLGDDANQADERREFVKLAKRAVELNR